MQIGKKEHKKQKIASLLTDSRSFYDPKISKLDDIKAAAIAACQAAHMYEINGRS